MKKLMIAAAIVCAAALSQAASFTWGFTQVADGYAEGKNPVAGTAYLFITQGANATKLITYESLTALYAAGDLAGLKAAAIDSAAVSGGAVSDKVSPTVAGLNDNTAYTVYAIVVNSDESQMYMTNAKSDKTDSLGGATLASFGKQMSTSTKKESWQAIPEPTSGLLLLLGVAGLALRRRRA